MAYNPSEVEWLKNYAQDIIERDYSPLIQELKNKLRVATINEKDLENKLKAIEQEWLNYQECHDCRKFMTEYCEVASQTTEPYELAIVNRPESKVNPICKIEDIKKKPSQDTKAPTAMLLWNSVPIPVKPQTGTGQVIPQTQRPGSPEVITITDSD